MKAIKRRSTSDGLIPPSPSLEKEVCPPLKQRRITRSLTLKVGNEQRRSDTFEKVVGPVLASGYLRWYEAENLSQVNKGSRIIWKEQKSTFPGWAGLLKELNMINCTNRCRECEQDLLSRANRSLCSTDQWHRECAARTPDFQGVADILMSSGVLTWREKGGMRKINKSCYHLYKDVCTCRPKALEKRDVPFVKHDPRYRERYQSLSAYEKCLLMTEYTSRLTQNLLSFYDISTITDPEKLPNGLFGWAWFDIQMVTLQRGCPRRYAMVMNMASLFKAQEELQMGAPKWYATALLGEHHDPVKDGQYEESLGQAISESLLPATDEFFCRFLRTKCYPSQESQSILGPLTRRLCIFAPFFKMVPLDEKKPLKLPDTLEKLDDEMIDSMSLQFFCSIS